MKERPILFSGPMVRAILDGSKTQTRRVVADRHLSGGPPEEVLLESCPYGQPGDRLWVREAWRSYECFDHLPPRSIAENSKVEYVAGGNNVGIPRLMHGMGKIRPSMFMPRWASRITLEITGIRVERLQEISGADASMEGVSAWADSLEPESEARDLAVATAARHGLWKGRDFEGWYAALWESINGPGSWAANPWVWVVEFARVKA
jgi:hypothetical protein